MTLPVTGRMSAPGEPVEPGKMRFINAVVAALTSGTVILARDLSGYGEGGWHSAATDLDDQDVYLLALEAWYRHAGVPVPASHLLHQEAQLLHSASVYDGTDNVVSDLGFLANDLMRWAWSADTSADPAGYRRTGRRSYGQCAITALEVQRRFGGELLRTVNAGVSHYFNRLPDGREVDLTRDQFDTWAPSEPIEVRTREYVLSHPDTAARYRRFTAALGVTV